MYLIKSNKSLV